MNESVSPPQTSIACRGCGAFVILPSQEYALIDENGYGHAVCLRCGAENLYPTEPSGPQRPPRRSLARRLITFALIAWLIILGMLLLLLPYYFIAPEQPEAEPDTRLFAQSS